MEQVVEPLFREIRILLFHSRVDFEQPLAVEPFLRTDRGGHDDRNAESGVERKLAWFRPENIGGAHGRVELLKIFVKCFGVNDGDILRADLFFNFLKVRFNFRTNAGDEIDGYLVRVKAAAQTVNDACGDLFLSTGTADGVCDGQFPVVSEETILFPEKIFHILFMHRPETVLRIEVKQSLTQVLFQNGKILSDQILRKGKARKKYPFFGDAVRFQALRRFSARCKIIDAAVPRLFCNPHPVDVHIADDAVGRLISFHIRSDCRGVERCNERQLFGGDLCQHAGADSCFDIILQQVHLICTVRKIPDRIEGGDMHQRIEHGEDRFSDDRNTARAGKRFIDIQ